MQLAVPLELFQIEAAARLRARLAQWQNSDKAIGRLKARCPGFNIEETLLKVVAINALYGTNVYAQVRMADHTFDVLRSTNASKATPLIVERLAALPKIFGETKERRFLSFASKFAHFFIDEEKFPILDKYAVKMVNFHLGRGRHSDPTHPYTAYVKNVSMLRERAGICVTSRHLDWYL